MAEQDLKITTTEEIAEPVTDSRAQAIMAANPSITADAALQASIREADAVGAIQDAIAVLRKHGSRFVVYLPDLLLHPTGPMAVGPGVGVTEMLTLAAIATQKAIPVVAQLDADASQAVTVHRGARQQQRHVDKRSRGVT